MPDLLWAIAAAITALAVGSLAVAGLIYFVEWLTEGW